MVILPRHFLTEIFSVSSYPSQQQLAAIVQAVGVIERKIILKVSNHSQRCLHWATGAIVDVLRLARLSPWGLSGAVIYSAP